MTYTPIHPAACPICGAVHDIGSRISGDVVYCVQCGGSFRVQWGQGDVTLTVTTLPATPRTAGRRKRK